MDIIGNRWKYAERSWEWRKECAQQSAHYFASFLEYYEYWIYLQCSEILIFFKNKNPSTKMEFTSICVHVTSLESFLFSYKYVKHPSMQYSANLTFRNEEINGKRIAFNALVSWTRHTQFNNRGWCQLTILNCRIYVHKYAACTQTQPAWVHLVETRYCPYYWLRIYWRRCTSVNGENEHQAADANKTIRCDE